MLEFDIKAVSLALIFMGEADWRIKAKSYSTLTTK